MQDDTYIITHDHFGNKLDEPHIIINKQDKNKIFFRENHSFFGTDVLYYVNYTHGRIDVFYDAVSLVFLGYKEANKDFVITKHKNLYIHINYSVEQRIKQLGYPCRYVNIVDKVEKIKKIYQKGEEMKLIKEIISDINRVRLYRLKKILSIIQKKIYQIKYDYNPEENDPIMEKYAKKLSNLITRDVSKKKDGKIFQKWKVVTNSLFFESLAKKTVNVNPSAKNITVDELSKYDENGNTILYFIVRELGKLIDLNTNKFTKARVTYLIIDIINLTFNLYNEEHSRTVFDLKRFNHVINSTAYLIDVHKKGHGLDNTGVFGEYKDPDEPVSEEANETIINDVEEAEAIDMDRDAEYDNIDYMA
jgi:hypothetical protein